MSLNNLIKDGGKILVVGGASKAWSEFRKYSQLEFWSGEQKEISRYLRDKEIPDNCKALVISRFISHTELIKVMDQARKRNITMFPNKNDGEIFKILDEITTDVKPDEKVVEVNEAKGRLAILVPFMDWSKTNIQNARDLMPTKVVELGIKTTEASLAQYVMKARHKINGTGHVASIKHNKLDLTVEMLDSMIRDLAGMRDFLIEVTEENRILKTKNEKRKKALREALED